MVNATGWEVAHADQFGRFDPAMSGNRSVGCVDKYRVDNPNSFMLAWIYLIHFAVCIRGLRARGFS
jgi:hypothetical protein